MARATDQTSTRGEPSHQSYPVTLSQVELDAVVIALERYGLWARGRPPIDESTRARWEAAARLEERLAKMDYEARNG